jgi:hypothetical protein
VISIGIATNEVLFLKITGALFDGNGFRASILLVVPQEINNRKMQKRTEKATIVFIRLNLLASNIVENSYIFSFD